MKNIKLLSNPSYHQADVWLVDKDGKEMVYKDERNPIPFKLYIKAKFLYLLNYYFLVYHSKPLGMQPTENFMKNEGKQM